MDYLLLLSNFTWKDCIGTQDWLRPFWVVNVCALLRSSCSQVNRSDTATSLVSLLLQSAHFLTCSELLTQCWVILLLYMQLMVVNGPDSSPLMVTCALTAVAHLCLCSSVWWAAVIWGKIQEAVEFCGGLWGEPVVNRYNPSWVCCHALSASPGILSCVAEGALSWVKGKVCPMNRSENGEQVFF